MPVTFTLARMKAVGSKLVLWGAASAGIIFCLAVGLLIWLESSGHGEPGVGIGIVLTAGLALVACAMVSSTGLLLLGYARLTRKPATHDEQ